MRVIKRGCNSLEEPVQEKSWLKRVRAWAELRKETKTVDSLCWDFTLQEKGTCMGQIQQKNKGYWKWTCAEKESSRHLKNVRIQVANTGCVGYLSQAWPPGLLLSYTVTLHSAEQGLAHCAKTPGACLILEKILDLAPSHPHAPQSSQGLEELWGPPWGLIHTIPTVLIQNHAILCPGKIRALSKWTISRRVTQVIHSVLQSFTCKYFIFLLNIFRWLWILDVMRTLLWNAGNTKDSTRRKSIQE